MDTGAKSPPHPPNRSKLVVARLAAGDVTSPSHPQRGFVDTHRGISDNDNSNSGGDMNEEQRKAGRPPKDKFVQAIEATIGESKPSAALLAAMVLPQIIATYGAGHVESNCNLAMKYAETLLTLDGE